MNKISKQSVNLNINYFLTTTLILKDKNLIKNRISLKHIKTTNTSIVLYNKGIRSSLGIKITKIVRDNTRLPKEIYEILIGLILEDGCLTKSNTSINNAYFVRSYSTNSSNPFIPAKIYSNADLQKQDIIKENQSKSGVY